jgi:GNAT superfamily N-acetyltransferase
MIRPATPADVPDLVDLGVRHLSETYAGRITPDRGMMAATARALIAAEHGLLLVDDRGGVVAGMLGVAVTRHPYSGEPVMSELFWYASPGARGGGVRLLKAAEAWARAMGVRHAIMIAPAIDERLASFYRRLDYIPLETQFIKAL